MLFYYNAKYEEEHQARKHQGEGDSQKGRLKQQGFTENKKSGSLLRISSNYKMFPYT